MSAGRQAPDPRELSRRALIVGAGVATATVAGAAALTVGASRAERADSADPSRGTAVAALGAHQAGVTRPQVPQPHCLFVVLDLDLDGLELSLGELGSAIRTVTDPASAPADLLPDGPGDLTVTVGLGPGALAATAHPELAELLALPLFAGDAELPDDRRGGDLLLSVNASDPTVLEPVYSWLAEHVAGARVRWSQFGFRGTPSDGISRNPLGYHDGIIGPRDDDELQRDVWISEGPLAGGTICVARRFRLDVVRFRDLPPDARDAVIGREQSSGAPLSGGERDDQIDLRAKSPDGTLLVPLTAHARAAHPAFTGSPLMLRRSYGFQEGADEVGHVFISFQNDVATFARTQLRLDDVDALMDFATPTATGAFAILPGMREGADLGASLF